MGFQLFLFDILEILLDGEPQCGTLKLLIKSIVIDDNTFHVFRLITLPVFQGGQAFVPVLDTPVVAINPVWEQFFPLEEVPDCGMPTLRCHVETPIWRYDGILPCGVESITGSADRS